MVRTGGRKKTFRINRATRSVSAEEVSAYDRDLEKWPRSWMGCAEDLPPGEQLVTCFRSFIEHLAATGFSRKTMRRHVDNLWLLGGEIIRDLNQTPSLRRAGVERLLRDQIYEDGGPLLYSGSENEQRSFDTTCRRPRGTPKTGH